MSIDPTDDSTTEPRSIVIVCELHEESGRSLSFDITEFVELATLSRVVVRTGRGWASRLNRGGNPWRFMSVASMESDVLGLWDLYREEEHGLGWMIPMLAEHGVHADLESIESLPVTVDLSPVIHEKLAEWGRPDDLPLIS